MAQLINVRLGIPRAIVLLLLAAASCSAKAPCGVRQFSAVPLTIGGEAAKPSHWPWHVALLKKETEKLVYFCGGSIISRELVVTAAHCFDDLNPEIVTMRMGTTKLSSNDGASYKIRTLKIYPNYNKSSLYNDIALIRPVIPIKYDPSSVAPICLWSAGRQSSEYEPVGIVAGFGATESMNFSDKLQQVRIKLLDKSTCKTKIRNDHAYLMNHTSKFCGKGEKEDMGVCYGDSGGGLYYAPAKSPPEDATVWYLRGIVSATLRTDHHGGVPKCDASSAQIYTDISVHSEWIEATQSIIDDRFLFEDDSCGVVRNDKVPNEASRPVFSIQYPWNALLEYMQLGDNKNPQIHLVCSGVLIHRRFVLTAGHCTEGTSKKYRLTSVRLGEFNLNTTDDTDPSQDGQTFRFQSIDVKAIFRYPKEIRPIKGDGLALLMLMYDADLTRGNIKPICLLGETYIPRTGLTLTGWKRNKFAFPELQRDLIERSALDECRNEFKQIGLRLPTSKRFICAVRAAPQPSKCHHSFSTGSPLQLIREVDGKQHYFLAGLSLYSLPSCHLNSSIIFVNINDAAEWIKATVLHEMLNLQKAAK